MDSAPPTVFCPLLKKSSYNPYLKFLDFSQLLVADTPMKFFYTLWQHFWDTQYKNIFGKYWKMKKDFGFDIWGLKITIGPVATFIYQDLRSYSVAEPSELRLRTCHYKEQSSSLDLFVFSHESNLFFWLFLIRALHRHFFCLKCRLLGVVLYCRLSLFFLSIRLSVCLFVVCLNTLVFFCVLVMAFLYLLGYANFGTP